MHKAAKTTLIFSIIYISHVAANPFAGLMDPNCFVTNMECPNENVTFWLYTNETRDNPVQLHACNLSATDFMPRRPVKIVIHGYTGHRDFSPNTHIRPVLLQNEDVYVISPDYGPLVRYPCYFAGVANVPVVSKCLGQLVNNLVEQQIVANEDIHVIGFSLGAQVAGQTANYVNTKLKRITGLDPAKPMFVTVADKHKLDSADAEFVDVIHTDVLGRGMLRAMGHADFYPNLGPYQPGCELEESPGSCNHERAPEYYAESIGTTNGFWTYACPSWIYIILGLCNVKGNDALMGYKIDQSLRGSFFLQTAKQYPFALGPIAAPTTTINESTQAINYYSIEEIDDDDLERQIRLAFADLNFNDIGLENFTDED